MRNVVVTGGSRGLGLSIARKLCLGGGYRVIAIARRRGDEFDAVQETMNRSRPEALAFIPFDLGNIAEIPHLVRGLRSEFGPIYGLVNNAGLGTSGVLAVMQDAQIEQLVRINTTSPLVLTKYLVRSMMADGGAGRIVNVASIVGFTGYSGLVAYGTTKSSLLGMTRSLAREVGSLGITVNAVAPGFLDTEMTQSLDEQQRGQIIRRSALHRLAEVDDVASVVEFLLGEAARNITGTVMTVDAGSTA